MSFSTLMYHEIREQATFNPEHPSQIDVKQGYADVLPAFLFVTLEHFEEQMAYLSEHNYHTLTLDEVKAYYYLNKSIPINSVLLTFDDCYQSVKLYAYPILKKYNFHAVAFVVTGWLHEVPKEFNPEKSICLAECELGDIADVFEFANHTDSFHQRTDATTSISMVASDKEFADDLDCCNSKELVQGNDVFAYPFGLYAERNISLLKNKGFQLAFTSERGQNDETTDPLLLTRNAIPYFTQLEDFKKIIN
ncbi:MAG: polysaccharide deacetylase family protein [Mobilitalea sp.]